MYSRQKNENVQKCHSDYFIEILKVFFVDKGNKILSIRDTILVSPFLQEGLQHFYNYLINNNCVPIIKKPLYKPKKKKTPVTFWFLLHYTYIFRRWLTALIRP